MHHKNTQRPTALHSQTKRSRSLIGTRESCTSQGLATWPTRQATQQLDTTTEPVVGGWVGLWQAGMYPVTCFCVGVVQLEISSFFTAGSLLLKAEGPLPRTWSHHKPWWSLLHFWVFQWDVWWGLTCWQLRKMYSLAGFGTLLFMLQKWAFYDSSGTFLSSFINISWKTSKAGVTIWLLMTLSVSVTAT